MVTIFDIPDDIIFTNSKFLSSDIVLLSLTCKQFNEHCARELFQRRCISRGDRYRTLNKLFDEYMHGHPINDAWYALLRKGDVLLFDRLWYQGTVIVDEDCACNFTYYRDNCNKFTGYPAQVLVPPRTDLLL
jgi:hypothetical protein